MTVDQTLAEFWTACGGTTYVKCQYQLISDNLLAVDIVTAEHPSLSRCFADWRAYRWLVRHAARFGFVESYPEGGRGGVIHEPWHWLYVGDNSHPIFVTDQGRHAR
jgi:hypothetical protein